jgi:hypothetical protein
MIRSQISTVVEFYNILGQYLMWICQEVRRSIVEKEWKCCTTEGFTIHVG